MLINRRVLPEPGTDWVKESTMPRSISVLRVESETGKSSGRPQPTDLVGLGRLAVLVGWKVDISRIRVGSASCLIRPEREVYKFCREIHRQILKVNVQGAHQIRRGIITVPVGCVAPTALLMQVNFKDKLNFFLITVRPVLLGARVFRL
jgi:hypothetical protein